MSVFKLLLLLPPSSLIHLGTQILLLGEEVVPLRLGLGNVSFISRSSIRGSHNFWFLDGHAGTRSHPMPSYFASGRHVPLSITVCTTNRHLPFDGLYPSTTILDLKLLIQHHHKVPAALQKVKLFGNLLDDQKTFEQCNITDGTVVDLILSLRRSMIYLLGRYDSGSGSESTKGVKVELSLNRAWEISLLRPTMKVSPSDYVQSVTWTMDAKYQGTLTKPGSTKEMFYICWDGL
jgi:prepilin-type processing-associated H-X9-DG protein